MLRRCFISRCALNSHFAPPPSAAEKEHVTQLRAQLSSSLLQRPETLPAFEKQAGFTVASLRSKWHSAGRAPSLPCNGTDADFVLGLTDSIAASRFGRFLLTTRGLNWEFTDLMFDEDHTAPGTRGGLSDDPHGLCSQFPAIDATQRRFKRFSRVTQAELDRLLAHGDKNLTLASFPCGRMRDLLTLWFPTNANNSKISLFALDKDPEAVRGAEQFATELGLLRNNSNITLSAHLLDATDGKALPRDLAGTVDILNSNGLNIYLNDADCERMYQKCAALLKPGGLFVTSMLSPPSHTKMDKINPVSLQLQAVAFGLIIRPLWSSHARAPDVVRAQLEAAGFEQVQVDTNDEDNFVFPTFVCRRKK